MNHNYPHPDPAWDYAQPYEELQQLKSDLDHLIAWLGSHEEADRDTDKVAKAKLDSLISSLTEIRELF
jgi:hypothetical protein